MKIKHWQGYGCVNAKVLRKTDYSAVIEVSGNHEWGLYRNDTYDIARWLLRHFIPAFNTGEKDYRNIFSMYIDSGYKKVNGLDTEYAIYFVRWN